MTICRVGYGSTVKLWHDKWQDDMMMAKYPHLYSFTIDKDITIDSALKHTRNDFYDMFHLLMSSIDVQQSLLPLTSISGKI